MYMLVKPDSMPCEDILCATSWLNVDHLQHGRVWSLAKIYCSRIGSGFLLYHYSP